MDAVVQTWTGREAGLLRKALRVSQREFAADLGYHHGAVSSWERRGENARLRTQTQRDLDTRLQRADEDTKRRFAAALQHAGAATDTLPDATPVTRRDETTDHPEAASRHPHNSLAASFLGRESVTILLPVKQESIKRRPVVAVEDVSGAQRLEQLAGRLGLSPSFDFVPADGEVDLNRANLLVVCGPRLSQPIADVLAQDGILRFEHHRRAWTIVDQLTGMRYRSGLDQNPTRSWDVGYLGRLPRPDQQGSLIVLTGIHPPGSLGVIQFLGTQIEALFAELKTDYFSLLLGIHFDPGSNEPRNVTLLTPIRRWESN